MAKQSKKSSPLPFLALLLACAVPGAGHVYLGRVQRGIIIFLTISALFWSGVAIGGVFTMDPVQERWWFVAEMLTGVHGLIGWHRQKAAREHLESVEGDSPDEKMEKEGIALVTPADTAARGYAGVAGLLNLLCTFDALMLSIMGVRGEPVPEDEKRKQKAEAARS